MPLVRLSRDDPPPLLGEPLVADAGAREVDHDVDPAQAVGVDRAGVGLPPHGVGVVAGAPDERPDPVTRAAEVLGQGGADEPAGPGDGDIHAVRPLSPDGGHGLAPSYAFGTVRARGSGPRLDTGG